MAATAFRFPLPFARFLRELDALLAARGITRTTVPPTFALNASPRIRRVQDFVEVHVGEALCLDDLADVAGLSRYHFSRVFREEVGQTPWAFVRHARVRRAKELLAEGRPPAEAAHAAGFFDQSHLTRVLREIDGRTPGEVRNAQPRDVGASEDTASDEISEAEQADRKIVQDR